MTFNNAQAVPWGKRGDVVFEPSNPFGPDENIGFTYQRGKRVIEVAEKSEQGEASIKFEFDQEKSEMIYVSADSGDAIICKPA
jgi:hypothetical protein